MRKLFLNSVVVLCLVSFTDSYASINYPENKYLGSSKALIEDVYSQTELLSQGSLEEVILYLKKLKSDKRFSSRYLQLFLDIQIASFYRDIEFKKGKTILSAIAKKIKQFDWPYLKSLYLLEYNVQQRALGKCEHLLINNDSIEKLLKKIPDDFQSKIEVENILDRVSVFICMENYAKAIEWLTQNENFFSLEKTDINTRLYFLNQLGFLHTQVGSYQSALNYYQEVLQILENEKLNELYFASVYNSLGVIYYMMNDVDNSLFYLSKAEIIYLKQNVNDDQLTFLYNLCELYLKLDQPKRALESANRFLFKAADMELYSAMAKYQIAQANLALNQGELSLKVLEEAIVVFEKENSTDYYLNSLELKAKILLAAGNYEEASSLLLRRAQVKDSLLSEEKISSLQDLLVKYESDKKDNLITLSKKQKELDDLQISQQKQFIFYLVLLIVVIVLSSVLLIRSIQQRNLFRRMEMRSKLTRAQFNPHFINNAFASMQSMVIMEQESEKLVDYISGVARFSRLMLESTFNDEWSLQNEVEFSEYFLKIHEIRFEGKLNYVLEIDIPDSNSYRVPSAIFQPVVENAIEHGGVGQQGGFVHIEIRKNNDSVIFIMKNSVKENKPADLKRKTDEPSRGMDILKQRIELHSRIYRKKSSFEFKLVDGVAVTEITLPLLKS